MITATANARILTSSAPNPIERTEYRGSYWKTTIVAAGVAGLGALPVFVLAPLFWTRIAESSIAMRLTLFVVLAGFLALCSVASLVVAGGAIALRRDALEAVGRPYMPRRPREVRPNLFSRAVRLPFRLIRTRRSLGLRPGDIVEVCGLDEILATLDADGKFDGLLFMPEMAAYCGQQTTVFRRVDKLNDWIHGTGLKRMHDTVQLDAARCSGEAHGGCQSDCRLRWKEAWLKRPKVTSRPAVVVTRSIPRVTEAAIHQIARRFDESGAARYTCQATELAHAGEPLAWGDPRHFVRDWVSGNVHFQALTKGVALALFNGVQSMRQGVGYPCMFLPSVKNTPSVSLGLRPGDVVRVRSKAEIEGTLNDRNRNRGLPFDVEMLRYCGAEFRVSRVLDRVIAEPTGLMRELTVPCIVLEGIRATAEYRAFNTEDEHIFWREIWLERVSPAAS